MKTEHESCGFHQLCNFAKMKNCEIRVDTC